MGGGVWEWTGDHLEDFGVGDLLNVFCAAPSPIDPLHILKSTCRRFKSDFHTPKYWKDKGQRLVQEEINGAMVTGALDETYPASNCAPAVLSL